MQALSPGLSPPLYRLSLDNLTHFHDSTTLYNDSSRAASLMQACQLNSRAMYAQQLTGNCAGCPIRCSHSTCPRGIHCPLTQTCPYAYILPCTVASLFIQSHRLVPLSVSSSNFGTIKGRGYIWSCFADTVDLILIPRNKANHIIFAGGGSCL